jgi:hypothetical protein
MFESYDFLNIFTFDVKTYEFISGQAPFHICSEKTFFTLKFTFSDITRAKDHTMWQPFFIKMYKWYTKTYMNGIVSRDGSWDKTMEWKIRPKLMVATPFFCLKIAHLEATVRPVVHPWM